MKAGRLIVYQGERGGTLEAARQRVLALARGGETACLVPGKPRKGIPKGWVVLGGWESLVEPLKKASKRHFKALYLENITSYLAGRASAPERVILDDIRVFCMSCRHQAPYTVVALEEPGMERLGPREKRAYKLFLESADEAHLLPPSNSKSRLGMKLKKGLIHVYTGEGKGKTTAAIGQAVRSAGAGLKVLVVQFFKPPSMRTGERSWKGKGQGSLEFRCPGIQHPLFNPGVSRKEAGREILKTLARVRREWALGKWGLVVLDEINNALRDGFLNWKTFAVFLDSKPKGVELICTGRGAPGKLVRRADYATEMKMLKHPFHRGTPARKGIEF